MYIWSYRAFKALGIEGSDWQEYDRSGNDVIETPENNYKDLFRLFVQTALHSTKINQATKNNKN